MAPEQAGPVKSPGGETVPRPEGNRVPDEEAYQAEDARARAVEAQHSRQVAQAYGQIEESLRRFEVRAASGDGDFVTPLEGVGRRLRDLQNDAASRGDPEGARLAAVIAARVEAARAELLDKDLYRARIALVEAAARAREAALAAEEEAAVPP